MHNTCRLSRCRSSASAPLWLFINLLTCAFKGLSPFASARLQHRNVCTTLAVEGLDTLRLGNMISSGVLQGCGVDHAFKGLIPFASACNRIYVPTLPSRGYSLRLGSSPFYFKRRKPHPDSERRCTQHWRFERRTKALRKASRACLSRNQGARCALK